MATCPAALSGQITQLTDLSHLVMRVTKTKSHMGYFQRKTRARFIYLVQVSSQNSLLTIVWS